VRKEGDSTMQPNQSEGGSERRFLTGALLLALGSLALLGFVLTKRPVGAVAGAIVLGVTIVGVRLVVFGVFFQRVARDGAEPTKVAAHRLPVRADPQGVPEWLGKPLAEAAVLAWKIQRRAEKEGGIPRPISRNAEGILDWLKQAKVEVVSYMGRKIDVGSRVTVQEAVEGEEEDKVIAEHEPEIQVDGRLARRALLTVGKGVSTSAEASDGSIAKPNNEPSSTSTKE